MTDRIKIYGDSRSGNCYKQQLVCAELGIEPQTAMMAIVMSGETRSDAFLAMNANGRVPLLELQDGRHLPESNAILWYLGSDSDLVPDDPYEAAEVLRWMFFEQYSHEPFIAVSRFIMQFLGSPLERQAELEAKQNGGYHALEVMERQLAGHAFIANDRFSIADIALYAYTHVAHEGGFSLRSYPSINDWLALVAARPNHVVMAGST